MVLNIFFYLSCVIDIIILILILINRKKEKPVNIYLEYSLLIFMLISFLLAIKTFVRLNILIFLIIATITIILRQIIKYK